MKKTYTKEEFNQFCEQNQEHGFEGKVSYNEQTKLYTIDDTPDYKLFNDNLIAEYQQNLINTDYVIIKINEAQVLNNEDTVNQLKVQYQDILQQRQNWRDEINKLQEENKQYEVDNNVKMN